MVSRYIFEQPLTWTEELGRYTFVWVSFLGMAVAIKHGSHIALDIMVKKFKGTTRKCLILINNFLVSTFSIFLIYSGFKLFQLGMRQDSPSIGLPMEVVYIVIPISGMLLFYFVIIESIYLIKQKGNSM